MEQSSTHREAYHLIDDLFVVEGQGGDALMRIENPSTEAGKFYRFKMEEVTLTTPPTCKVSEVEEIQEHEALQVDLNFVEEIMDAFPGRFHLVDVRMKEQFNQGHMEEAISIPLEDLDTLDDKAEKTDPVIVYCNTGNRTKSATRALKEMGYTNVIDANGIDTYKGELSVE